MYQTIFVIIDTELRVFTPALSADCSTLSLDLRGSFVRGAYLELGAPMKKSHEHRDKVALPVICKNGDLQLPERFVLYEELSPLKRSEIRRLFADSPVFRH